MIELGSRKKDQPPPPWVVWEALTEPNRDPIRQWLQLRADEMRPQVLEAAKPGLVVWSSLWPDRPHDQIHFVLEPSGSGCLLQWSLLTPDDPPDEARVRQLCYRLNVLINRELRYSFGQ